MIRVPPLPTVQVKSKSHMSCSGQGHAHGIGLGMAPLAVSAARSFEQDRSEQDASQLPQKPTHATHARNAWLCCEVSFGASSASRIGRGRQAAT